jgi:hypothetical protein
VRTFSAATAVETHATPAIARLNQSRHRMPLAAAFLDSRAIT